MLPVLESVSNLNNLDFAVSQWVEDSWADGEALYLISDALCGLHYFEPWSKRRIPNAWRLFSTWRKMEVPSRAPPLTAQLVRAMATYALAHQDLVSAALLLVGFYGLLRTGKLLALRTIDILVTTEHAILSLPNTKSGKRKGAHEMVHLEDPFTVEVIMALTRGRKEAGVSELPLWRYSGSAFRCRFYHYCHKFALDDFKFRPYSLRRGGATHHFQLTKSMDSALLLGRWESVRVAKIYISDALSFLPAMTLSQCTKRMLKHYSPPL